VEPLCNELRIPPGFFVSREPVVTYLLRNVLCLNCPMFDTCYKRRVLSGDSPELTVAGIGPEEYWIFHYAKLPAHLVREILRGLDCTRSRSWKSYWDSFMQEVESESDAPIEVGGSGLRHFLSLVPPLPSGEQCGPSGSGGLHNQAGGQSSGPGSDQVDPRLVSENHRSHLYVVPDERTELRVAAAE